MKPVDNAVLVAMQAYLRVCRSGGMDPDESSLIEAAVDNAADLGYFTLVFNDHGETLLRAIERNRQHALDQGKQIPEQKR